MAPSISLCMILRDEAELLPRFLERARGAWDELVAVDTGSVDATPALLEAAGARLLREPWRDDFAAARNVGLQAATGDWILVLDADELLAPEAIPALRAAAADPAIGAATLLLRNQLPHGHRHDARLLRAFRRDARIRYRHPIHEDVTEEVLALLAAEGRRLVHLPGVTQHLGYIRTRAAARGKRDRDARLLGRLVEQDPGDLYAHFKLLELARFWRDRGLWRRAALGALGAMEAATGRLGALHFGGELAVLVAEGLEPGAPAQQLDRLLGWAPLLAPSAALSLRLGELRERAGEPAAELDFERCLALVGQTANEQLALIRPLLGLARVRLARRDFARSLELAERALAAAPADPEALLAAAALHRLQGGPGALLAFVASHARRHGDSAELNGAAGEAALLAGDRATALGAYGRAAELAPDGREALRLAQLLFATGDLPAARKACERLSPALAEAALGLLLCDLVEGKDSALELEFDQEEADAALRGWIGLLRTSGEPQLIEAVRRCAPALAGPFPWLASELE